jgi:hypothetical protein
MLNNAYQGYVMIPTTYTHIAAIVVIGLPAPKEFEHPTLSIVPHHYQHPYCNHHIRHSLSFVCVCDMCLRLCVHVCMLVCWWADVRTSAVFVCVLM